MIFQRARVSLLTLLLAGAALPAAFADDAAPAAVPAFAAGDAEPTDLLMSGLLLGSTHAGERIVAVGEYGHVALSDDQGKTWRQAAKVPTQATLTSVTFIDAKNGWAAGHDKTIIATTDGGETWTLQYSRDISAASGLKLEPRGRAEAEVPAAPVDGALPAEGTPPVDGAAPPADDVAANDGISTDEGDFVEGDVTGSDVEPDIPFLGLVFTSPTHGIAVGGFNYAVETNDGGKTWTPRRLVKTASDDFHLNAAFNGPNGSLYVPSEQGQIYRSLDNGATWDIVQTDYEGSFWNGLTLADGSVLIVGMRGNAWRSADAGATWTQLAADVTPESIAGGAQLADGTIVLVGIGGLVMTSKDNGATWDTGLSQTDRKGIASVLPGHDGTLLLFGESGFREKAMAAPQG